MFWSKKPKTVRGGGLRRILASTPPPGLRFVVVPFPAWIGEVRLAFFVNPVHRVSLRGGVERGANSAFRQLRGGG